MKLVALGMTAKIVVIVQNQYSRGRILFAVKISCG